MNNISNIIDGYLSGKSCNELGIEFGYCAMTIYKHLIRNGITMRRKWEGRILKLPKSNLSDYEKQIIDGCLLSDGSVFCKNERSTANFSFTSIHKNFIDHIQSILPLLSFRTRHRINGKRNFHGKEYNCSDSYELISNADKSLNEFRKLWYPNGIKIIPRNLILSPITIKYWFYGDGSTSYIKYKDKNRYIRISFCTNGFTIDDCEFLVSKLEECGLKFSIYLSRKQPMLVALKTKIILDFFDYIGDCNVSCFNYKWKKII